MWREFCGLTKCGVISLRLRRPFLASRQMAALIVRVWLRVCAVGGRDPHVQRSTRARGLGPKNGQRKKSGGLLLLRAAVLVHSRARFGALGLATGPRACGVGVVPGGRVLQRSRVRVGSRLAAQALPVVAVMQANIELAEVRTYVGMFASTRMLESACVLQHTTMVSPAATLFR